MCFEAGEVGISHLQQQKQQSAVNSLAGAVLPLAPLTCLHSPKWSSGNMPFSGGFAPTPLAPPKAAICEDREGRRRSDLLLLSNVSSTASCLLVESDREIFCVVVR